MAQDPSEPNYNSRELRVAWRYLAAKGIAPFAPADPVAQALSRLSEEADADWRRARQDLLAAGAVAVAAVTLFLRLLTLEQTLLWAQVALRAAIAIAITCALNDAADAIRRWLLAQRLRHAVRTGLVEEAFTRAFAIDQSWCPNTVGLGNSERRVS